MKQCTTITPKKFLELPLSEAILWVIEDIKKFKAAGVEIDMSNWYFEDRQKLCAVCAGGAAALGFLTKKEMKTFLTEGFTSCVESDQYLWKALGINEKEYNKIAYTFDHIRSCEYKSAVALWNNNSTSAAINHDLYSEIIDMEMKHEALTGKLYDNEIKVLIDQMKQLSKLLKKYNY